MLLDIALRQAAKLGNLDLVRWLLSRGASVNSQDKDGYSAILLAAENGSTRVVAELLEHGADVHAKTRFFGRTALHFVALIHPESAAADNNCADVVALLLAYGANVHACSNSGSTALHYAVRYGGSTQVAEMLWRAGADPRLKNNRDETPLSTLQRGSQLAEQMRSAPSPPLAPSSPTLSERQQLQPERNHSAAFQHQQPMRSGPSSSLPPLSLNLSERQQLRPDTSRSDTIKLQQPPFRIFLSHAGEDKETVARPLYHGLRKHGLSVFFDVESFDLGDHSPDVMNHAMETAPVGVFIMSPEFVAKKWPMHELLVFVRRYDHARAANLTSPLLIPVFYRLSIHDCRDPDILDKYGDLFRRHRLLKRAADASVPLFDVRHALDIAATVWSIENDLGASNLVRQNMVCTREAFIQMVLERILERLHIEKQHEHDPKCVS